MASLRKAFEAGLPQRFTIRLAQRQPEQHALHAFGGQAVGVFKERDLARRGQRADAARRIDKEAGGVHRLRAQRTHGVHQISG